MVSVALHYHGRQPIADGLHWRSFRIYPHLQDTGGFFVAVLQRRDPIPRATAQKSDARRTAETSDSNLKTEPSTVGEPAAKRIKIVDDSEGGEKTPATDAAAAEEEPIAGSGGTLKEDPYTFVSPTDPTLLSCMFVRSCSIFVPPLLTGSYSLSEKRCTC